MRKQLFVLFLLALGVPFGAGAAPMFRNPLPVPTGTTYVEEMMPADFNGDGRDDVLLLGTDLVVLIANGTGPFAAPVVTPIPGFSCLTPAIGDVNGDGRNDVVLSHGETAAVGVLLGNGDGTFAPGPSFTATHQRPTVLALADFNGDSKLDLAVNSLGWSSDHFIAIYPGDGAGHFAGAVATSVDQPVTSLQPFDMNGDGKMDLVASSLILLGNGNGSFTMGGQATGGDVVVADFNHDSKRDLAVATDNGLISISFGNGDGTLMTAVPYAAGAISAALDSADVNGDGHLDLLAASRTGSAVAVLRGKADGTFHPAERWVADAGARLIVADDFDRDGKVDFLTHGDAEFRALSFVRGNGDGTFRTYRSAYTPEAYNVYLAGGATADMNNDGKVDVVVMQRHPYTNLHDLYALLNDGTGKLTPVVTATGVEDLDDFATVSLGDVNNDGKVDVVAQVDDWPDGVKVRVFRGNGDGTFTAPIGFDTPSGGRPFLGHFDGDANVDLFLAAGQWSRLHSGNGDGTFDAGVYSATNQMTHVQNVLAGDLNGDGKLDYVNAWIRDIDACMNDGNGNFTCQSITGDEISTAALADFNDDQTLDLLLTTYTGTQVRFGNGNGTFGAPVSFEVNPVPNYPHAGPVRTADFDGDGHTDVAFGTTVYLGDGNGRFPRGARFRAADVDAMHVADMDGSGTPDLVVLNSFAHDVDVLLTYTTADPTAQSSLTLTANKSNVEYAHPVKLTAAVTGSPALLTGMVAFAIDGQPVALRTVNVIGQTTFNTPFFPGLHEITARYVGDENYLGSDDETSVSVVKATTTATVKGTPNPQPAARVVTITTTLAAPQTFGWPGPTGARTLRDGDTPLDVTLVNGKATISTLSLGSHVISFDYAGDANYEPATASYTQVITKPVPTLRIEVTPASEPFLAGSPMTFRAYVEEAGVTGTVEFRVDQVYQGSMPLTDGSASIQRSFPWGYHSVSVQYWGDSTWAPAGYGVSFDVFIGPWGTPLALNATGFPQGTLHVEWAQIAGAVSYTLWRKQSVLDGWQAVKTYSAAESEDQFFSVEPFKTFLFAVTAKDGSGNVSPMSAPDLATTIPWGVTSLQANYSKIKAQDVLDLRMAVGSVRTFANLTAYPYSNAVAAGQPVRAADVQEVRTALAQARTAIGLPAITWTTPAVISPGSAIRAAHSLELRSGTN